LAWQPRGTAELRVLDKVSARVTPLSVKVGASAGLGSLTVAVRGCLVRPPDQPADAAAFLEIADSRPGAAGFRGWMFANEPAIAVFEDPIYDVRVIGCRG
jgi:hypothetical protein